MGPVVYALCAVTAFACCGLLLRRYLANRSRLLLWSGLCFAGLTLNNTLVLLDLSVVREADLFPLRNAVALASMSMLLFGLIWEAN